MIVVQNHIKVNPKYSLEFESAFSGTNKHLSGMKGFVKNEILKPVIISYIMAFPISPQGFQQI